MEILKRLRAFTLVELLIVITIIGILAVALVPRITGGPAKARDAARKADLQQIATALEFYADDNSGNYPDTACVSDLDLGSYLTTVPDDPKDDNFWSLGECDPDKGYDYVKVNDGGGYMLIAKMEVDTATGDGLYEDNSLETASDATAATNLADSMPCGDGGDCTDDNAVYVLGR